MANLKKSISHETEKYTIRANDAKSIVQTWLQANGTSLDGKKELNDLRLTKLAETTEWTDEKLQKLWEGAEKNEAYKLLNWLFTHSDTTARNTLSTTAEY